MIIYRDDPGREAAPRPLLEGLARRVRALPASPDTDAATGLLIEWGELEAGLADALFPERDGIHPTADAARAVAGAVGALFHRAEGAPFNRPPADAGLAGALDALARAPLPARVRLRTAEGFAWYALFPRNYRAAALRVLAAVRPARVICIGLRSIGAALSAVVAGTLAAEGCAVLSLTLRPRGPAFDRRPVADPALAERLQGWRESPCLIVDEGPGLSGTSLCGTAAWLSGLGFADDRILLLPAWDPDAVPYMPDWARDRWARHPRICTPLPPILSPKAQDLSGGVWRGRVYEDPADWPAVQPQHERVKVMTEGSRLLKFTGLGRYGEPKAERARRLADAGFHPPVLGLRNGFLETAWVPGRPALGQPDPALAGRLGDYLALVARSFPGGREAPVDDLFAMVRANAGFVLGRPWLDRLGRLERWRPSLAGIPTVAGDGRMLPQDWIRTAAGWLKTDAVDHHDDHFFPGTQDIAWDLAGTAAEFRLSDAASESLAAGLAARLHDATLPRRLPFYRMAYLAFRLGYASLAADTLAGTPDGRRMAALAARYGIDLREAIMRLGQP